MFKKEKIELIITFLLSMVIFFLIADFVASLQIEERGCKDIITFKDAMNAGGAGVILAFLCSFISVFIWWFIIKGIKNICREERLKEFVSVDSLIKSSILIIKKLGNGIVQIIVKVGEFIGILLFVFLILSIVIGIILSAGWIAGHISMWIYCT
jgi:hypothetical protein